MPIVPQAEHPRNTKIFDCPTTGRRYAEHAPIVDDDLNLVWSRCYWCDEAGRVRGQHYDFDRSAPCWHSHPVADEQAIERGA